MSVIPITIFFSLLLAGFFVVLFAREQRRHRFASNERDSLLPLAEETPRVVTATATRAHDPAADDDHDHEHAPGHDHPQPHHHGRGRCGCESGVRPPCSGCLRRTSPAATPVPAASPLS